MIFKQYIPSYRHHKLFISIQPYMLGWDFLRLQQFWFRFSSHTSLFGFKLTRRWQWHSTTTCYALLHWGDPSFALCISECHICHCTYQNVSLPILSLVVPLAFVVECLVLWWGRGMQCILVLWGRGWWPREELAGHVFWLQPRGTYSGEGLRGYLGRHGKGAGLGIEG